MALRPELSGPGLSQIDCKDWRRKAGGSGLIRRVDSHRERQECRRTTRAKDGKTLEVIRTPSPHVIDLNIFTYHGSYTMAYGISFSCLMSLPDFSGNPQFQPGVSAVWVGISVYLPGIQHLSLKSALQVLPGVGISRAENARVDLRSLAFLLAGLSIHQHALLSDGTQVFSLHPLAFPLSSALLQTRDSA